MEELSEIRRRQEGSEQGDESQLRPVRISLIGHSVGAEIAVQTMRRLDDHLETSSPPDHKIPKPFEMNASLLLFPTIAHIAQTPNGRKLRPIFHAPLIHLLPVLCYFIHPLIQVVRLALSLVPTSTSPSGTTGSSIYAPNATTLRFLSSPTTVKHVLHLAQSEMVSITRPDLAWYENNTSRLWSYWGKEDGWVGGQGDEVKRVLRGGDGVVVDDQEGEQQGTEAIGRVVDCVDSIPHAFCLGGSGGGATLSR
jgi:pimeloyl-ACP methyl ester carboxylesterase